MFRCYTVGLLVVYIKWISAYVHWPDDVGFIKPASKAPRVIWPEEEKDFKLSEEVAFFKPTDQSIQSRKAKDVKQKVETAPTSSHKIDLGTNRKKTEKAYKTKNTKPLVETLNEESIYSYDLSFPKAISADSKEDDSESETERYIGYLDMKNFKKLKKEPVFRSIESFEINTYEFLKREPVTEPPMEQDYAFEQLRRARVIKSPEVLRAMQQADLRDFVEPYLEYLDFLDTECLDGPLPMYVYALETLKDHLKEGSKVLDVATWSPYLTVCMSYMVGETGYAVTVRDNTTELKQIMSSEYPELYNGKRVKLINGDIRKGAPNFGPYDVIHCGLNATRAYQTMAEQLKIGGRMLLTVYEDVTERHRYAIVDKKQDGSLFGHERLGSYIFPMHRQPD